MFSDWKMNYQVNNRKCLKVEFFHLFFFICNYVQDPLLFDFKFQMLLSKSVLFLLFKASHVFECPQRAKNKAEKQLTVSCETWLNQEEKKILMMWSFAAIFDFLRRLSGLSGYFKALAPQRTWECNSAASGSSAIFKTHFISVAPPFSRSLSFDPGKLTGVSNNDFFWNKGGRKENERAFMGAGGKEELQYSNCNITEPGCSLLYGLYIL